jgi:hypothetical protein
VVAFAAGSSVSGHCADYPDGHRCTTGGYGLIVLSIGCAVAAIATVLAAVVSRLRRRRRFTQPGGTE